MMTCKIAPFSALPVGQSVRRAQPHNLVQVGQRRLQRPFDSVAQGAIQAQPRLLRPIGNKRNRLAIVGNCSSQIPGRVAQPGPVAARYRVLGIEGQRVIVVTQGCIWVAGCLLGNASVSVSCRTLKDSTRQSNSPIQIL